MTKPRYTTIREIESYFMDIRREEELPNDLSMDCLCLIASGIQNASMTLGWDNDSEEWSSLAIRSVECLLETQSEEVCNEFLKIGISY